MSIPKSTKLTLRRIVEAVKDGSLPDNGFGEKAKTLSAEQKRNLMDMASKYETFGECLHNEEALMESAKGITQLCELAEQYAVCECGDAFARNIVERDMKELKKRVMEFQKCTKETYARMQQLGVAYQDIGHVLGRYFDLKPKQAMGLAGGAEAAGGNDVMMGEASGKRICAWCNQDMGDAAGEGDTHGICEPCKQKMLGGTKP